MSERSYKIDIDIVNTSRNKRKIQEINNQVSEVISDLVDRTENILARNPNRRNIRDIELKKAGNNGTFKTIHCYLVALSLAQSSAQKII